MAITSALVNVITGAAKKAARGLARDFGELQRLQTSRKSPEAFVDKARQRTREILEDELGHARPKARFRDGPDAGPADANAEFWIVAPLEGELNFLHGLPHTCISIAFEKGGKTLAACIHDPVLDETFWAERGQGGWLNRNRLRVASRRYLKDAVVAVDSAQSVIVEGDTSGFRLTGCTALDLAWLADGRFDACVFSEWTEQGCAAGIMIVGEAGGILSAPDGSAATPDKGLIAGNDLLHEELRARGRP